MKDKIIEKVNFTLCVPSIGYEKTITLTVKEKSIVKELHDDIIKKLSPNKYIGNERKYVEGALKHIDFLVDENVIFSQDEGLWEGLYNGKIKIREDESFPRDDIKITIFHEFLHHVNYMEKIFPYRYQKEEERAIFSMQDDCYTFGETDMEDILTDYMNDNWDTYSDEKWNKLYKDLGEEEQKILLDYKNKNIDKYKEHCQEGTYRPSNYYRDEIAVYTICLRENHNLFVFSDNKENNKYIPNLKSYKKILQNSIDFEHKNNYNEIGFKKK